MRTFKAKALSGIGALFFVFSCAASALTPSLASLSNVPVAAITEALGQKIDRAARNIRPYQFAVRAPTSASLADGRWEEAAPGLLRWRLRLASPGAQSISLEFARFQLPSGAALWFSDPEGRLVQGPYTRASQTLEGKLWTAAVLGGQGVIELQVPAAAKDQVRLQLAALHHGFRALAPKDGVGPGSAGGCHNDAVCPIGDAWRDQARSVAFITVGGAYLCTGQMVNNTLQNDDPLFVTANHCNIGQTDATPASSVVFYWNYRNSFCRAKTAGPRSTDGSLAQNQSGSTLLARDPDSDMTLVRLYQLPAPEFNVYYSGWNATTDTPHSGVSLHHPSGDVEMVSVFGGDAQRSHTTIAPNIDAETWQVTWADGTTEGGSSGGGLWDQNHRIVGWLSGGNASCNNPGGTDNFGRMELAWDSKASADQQLRAHLAPDGSDTLVLDGKDFGGGPATTGSGGDVSSGEERGGAAGLSLLMPLSVLAALRRQRIRLSKGMAF